MAKVSDQFPPGSKKAKPFHFRPTDKDRERSPVMITVWDRSRTTLEQAGHLGPQRGEYVAFALDVAQVRAIQLPEQLRPLSVIRDPLDPPKCDEPGADGHCGLTELGEDDHGGSKVHYRLRDELARLAVYAEPE